MGMMPDGQSPMQKRPYPGGPPGPYPSQYGGRQYSGMSPQMFPNPMYAGNRTYSGAPGSGAGGGSAGSGAGGAVSAGSGQFPQQVRMRNYILMGISVAFKFHVIKHIRFESVVAFLTFSNMT